MLIMGMTVGYVNLETEGCSARTIVSVERNIATLKPGESNGTDGNNICTTKIILFVIISSLNDSDGTGLLFCVTKRRCPAKRILIPIAFGATSTSLFFTVNNKTGNGAQKLAQTRYSSHELLHYELNNRWDLKGSVNYAVHW